ncbi:MAG: hypothetical protein J0L92_35545 [Deltaproteobacteria bacterium]|nr:hypothetical protein [Deltaproteobacteria bacterium]
MTLPTDTREEGLAIGVLLSRPATADDVHAAQDLLDDWLDRYDSGEAAPRYRNCGVEGSEGARELTLWCDRLDDAAGTAAAIEHARSIAAKAREVLPTAGVEITAASAVSARDLDARLGAPSITVGPGGDLVGDMMAAGIIPRPPGLRPSQTYVLVLGIAIAACTALGAPMSTYVRTAAIVLGVGGLAFASRAWTSTTTQLLAAATVITALLFALARLGTEGRVLPIALAIAVLITFVAWSRAWVKSR